MTASVRIHRWRGSAAVTLVSGPLQATFVPELNLLGTSLRLDGEEFLDLPGGLATYRHRHQTGLPLLAPWANRLGAWAYRVRRTRVNLEGLDLYSEGGLPLHGTMTGANAWSVQTVSARGEVARLRASFDYVRQDLLAAFPFPHRLERECRVDGRSLSVTTTVRPAGDRAVPVSFGFHPYLRLPSGPRSSWRLLLPKRQHLSLDERGIPSGRRVEQPPESDPIGARTFDDLYELSGGRRLGIAGSERSLFVEFGRGYRFAQVFAPAGARFVCLEPMTAPTNALVAGGYPVVSPGESFTARFSIRPERATSPGA
jgi:aldose 1-epimerase